VTLYLLDTNIVSDALRRPTGPIPARIKQVGRQNVAISILVAAELKFGAVKRKSAKLAAAIEGFIARSSVLPFEAPAEDVYAKLRDELETAGTPIGALDTLIAAHAVALDATLVTDNEREFSRVKGLKVENWLR
jgi:tRNA(fMet)-specific endonuclease VapC